MRKNILILLFALIASFCYGQQDFWRKIELPTNINKVYSVASDSRGWDYIATNRGILLSKDNGETIEQTALQQVVYHVHVNEEDKIFASGNGNVFYSDDFGNSLDGT